MIFEGGSTTAEAGLIIRSNDEFLMGGIKPLSPEEVEEAIRATCRSGDLTLLSYTQFSPVCLVTEDAHRLPSTRPWVVTEEGTQYLIVLTKPERVTPIMDHIGKPLYPVPALFDWALHTLRDGVGIWVNPGATDLASIKIPPDALILIVPHLKQWKAEGATIDPIPSENP
jgi:hypothetical protein